VHGTQVKEMMGPNLKMSLNSATEQVNADTGVAVTNLKRFFHALEKNKQIAKTLGTYYYSISSFLSLIY
jgi:hypothetical protein